MPEYRFINTQPLIYAAHGLRAEPGETYDWPDDPPADGMWVPVDEESPNGDDSELSTDPAPTTDAPTTEEVV